MIERLLVMAGLSCNNNCVFCSARGTDAPPSRPTVEIAGEIIASRRRCNAVEFIGGEFTIRPDAVVLVRLCRENGYRGISIETNGARLAYKEFAASLCAAGLSGVSFSLHGATAKTHDALTRTPGSHALLLKGLENVKALGLGGLRINCVVTKRNITELAAIAAKFEHDANVDAVRFLALRPMEHLDTKQFMELVPPLELLKKYLPKLAEFKKAELKNFPWCIGGPPRRDALELKTLRKSYGGGSGPENIYASLQSLMAYAPVCAKCGVRGACLGVWKRYLEVYGPGGLSAV